jgi:hypothetical protein
MTAGDDSAAGQPAVGWKPECAGILITVARTMAWAAVGRSQPDDGGIS